MNEPPLKNAGMLAAIWKQQEATVRERTAALEYAAIAAIADDLTREVRESAETAAHRLSGSLGMFGLPAGSSMAREIESLLAGREPLDTSRRLELSELVMRLIRLIDEFTPAGGATPPNEHQALPRVLVVTGESERPDRLTPLLLARGFEAVPVPDPHSARRALIEGPFSAAVLMPADGARPGFERLVGELLRWEPPVPAIVVGGGQSFLERARLARFGVRLFLPAATPDEDVADAVASCALDGKPGGYVLLVDDDLLVREAVTASLGGAGFDVTAVASAEEFWHHLHGADPDLVILDIQLPGIDGIDLCRALRTDPRWMHLPVLFLTARSDSETVRTVFASGADDFVAKPFVGPELTKRVQNRLERSRVGGVSLSDRATGLPRRGRCLEAAENLLAIGTRCGAAVSVAVVELPWLNSMHADDGHAVADQVMAVGARSLVAAFRSEDVVGRWTESGFLVALVAEDLSSTRSRLRRAADLFEAGIAELPDPSDGRSWCVGVAVYPEDGRTLDQLLSTAEHRAGEAGERSAGVVTGRSDEDRRAEDRIDILVVEDDEALQALLLPTLEANGYSVRLMESGAEAIRALTGPGASLRPRLILLDVDLPGADGYAVLRQVRRETRIESTAVIMLTGRGREDDVVDALRLGAVDHVTKPFSMAVLLQRIARTVA